MRSERKSSRANLSGTILACIVILFFSLCPGKEGLAAEQTSDAAGSPHVQENKEKFSIGPHKNLACVECHTSAGSNNLVVDAAVAVSIEQCRKCHPQVITHPLDIEILPEASRAVVHSLPFSKEDLIGRISCLTCHVMHVSEEGQNLLKGKQTNYRAQRTSLCLHCHRDRFQRKSPHDDHEKACGYCHIARPAKKAQQQGPPDVQMQASCDLCHNELADDHYPGSDPFIDVVIREEAIQAGILPENGQPACTSCHDHHGKTDGKGLLSVAYLTLCSKSRSIDPHWSDLHCWSCHEEKPTKDDSALRHKGDSNALCNRCHASEYARSDIHPVGLKPSQHIRIPKYMPLEDGLLTCTTCHDSRLQAGCVKKVRRAKTNVLFLRGKLKSRTSFCFLCHIEESYKLLNPHEQVNEQGEIQEITCLFCHSSIPDVQVLGPGKVGFVVQNPDAYCIGCHHGFVRKHPAGIDHLRVPSPKILATLKTSIQRIGVELPLYKGKVVCATCHNPHQTGVIKFSAAATGTKRDNKLRLMPGIMQCVGCHWDKR
ncbi:MAG: hypothetical protein KJ804_02110 [Proteobacteria bacterium]|nr:hypothetical protein [Pseudomonadota bacterium]MBU1057100.1 hypothetical protein [Pseudomonadota bacterium]